MYENDPRIQRTQQLMFDALAELAGEKSLDEITVSDIIKRCRIARTTFYRYYEDKNDFLEKVKSELLLGLFDYTDHHPKKEGDSRYFHNFFEYFYIHRKLFSAFTKAGKWPEFKETLYTQGVSHYTELFRDYPLQKGIRPEILANYLVGAHMQVLMGWLETGFQTDPEELARITSMLSTEGALRIAGIDAAGIQLPR